MAALIKAGGALSTVANTAIESTASDRYVRVSFYNTGASTRTINFKIGSQQIKQFTLTANDDRTAGPHAVASGETVQAWQDVGTDVNFRVTGEVPN